MSIDLVKQFHDKFNLPAEPAPGFPGVEDMVFRLSRQDEELEELSDAYTNDDIVGAFDALIDAAYIIYGTALRLGITPEMWNRGFAAVHEANMAKVRAAKPAESKYKNAADIIKPVGWTSPESKLAAILFGPEHG